MRVQGKEAEWSRAHRSRYNDQKLNNLRKEMNIQFQEAQRTPMRVNPKGLTLTFIIIKLSKGKPNFESLKPHHIQGSIIRLPAKFSAETSQARRE